MVEVGRLTKQDDIKEGIHDIVGDCLIKVGCGNGGCPKTERLGVEAQEACIQSLLFYLDSLGVGIKGSSLGGTHPHLAGYYTFESLIKELDGAE